MKTERISFILTLFLVVCTSYGQSDTELGYFNGNLQVELLDDGRYVELLNDISYVDPDAYEWTAKKGYKYDGASIPKTFWSFVGGPFTGKYRKAAFIHDYYCFPKTRHIKSSKEVHLMFYYAMRAAGVSVSKAKLLYYAVLLGGPKWKLAKGVIGMVRIESNPTVDLIGTDVNAIDQWIKENSPTLEEIEQRVLGE